MPTFPLGEGWGEGHGAFEMALICASPRRGEMFIERAAVF